MAAHKGLMIEKSLLVKNARIYTMDAKAPVASALAVIGDRIAVVGAEVEARAALRGRTNLEEWDAEGNCLLPGLIDAHTHFLEWSKRMVSVDLEGVPTLEDALKIVREFAERQRGHDDQWIVGGGWNKNIWGAGGFPTRRHLDSVAPDNPVALSSKDGHSLWVNSRALDLAGVNKATEDPDGGRLLRDGDGRPSGILQETAQGLVWRLIPDGGLAENQGILRQGMRAAVKLGLTGVHTCEGAATMRALQAMDRDGDMALRVNAMIPADSLDAVIDLGLAWGFGSNYLKIGPLKLFADGALGSQTAYMYEPYEGDGDYAGILVMTLDDLKETIARAVKAGMPVAAHAIGDRSNSEVLSAIGFAMEEAGLNPGDLRHRIEHAQCVRPEDLKRFAEQGVIASVQPLHATSDRYIVDRHWGERRGPWAYAFKNFLTEGVSVAFGSDAPVESIDPLKGIYAAVSRKREDEPDSEPWYPDQRLTREEAVFGYTVGAAFAGGDEGRRGMLSPGMLADFILLDRDIMKCPEGEIPGAEVLLTVVGGSPVHSERW